jgi:Ti-type conjugative transfer relaxase TraA
MAIAHLHMRPLTRAKGNSADEYAEYLLRQGRHEAKADELVHTESGNMPTWAKENPRAYWQATDEYERANGCLCREIEFALPRELNRAQQIELASSFAKHLLDAKSLPWTIAFHDAGTGNPHVHLVVSERQNDGIERDPARWFKRFNAKEPEKGGALKSRELSASAGWTAKVREEWEQFANDALERAGHVERISMASYAVQGMEIVPGIHLGKAGHMETRGIETERVAEQAQRVAEQRAAIEANPAYVLDKLTHTQATFGRQDIARELGRYVDEPSTFANLMARIEASPELVLLQGKSGESNAIYSTRSMVETEAMMAGHAAAMAQGRSHALPLREFSLKSGSETGSVVGALAEGPRLSDEQQAALAHILGPQQLAVIAGVAGSGKSTTLGAARSAWEAEGYRVIGAALAGKAADGLQEGSGIQSSTIASLEHRLSKGQERLGARDVLVIDEAGMVGSRQMARVLDAARNSGAKVVLVGDAEQLQPIEAGAAFRAIAERIGFAEIGTVRRQREEWAQEASRAFSRGHTRDGLQAYEQRGAVRGVGTRDDARTSIAADYLAEAKPGQSQIILAHSNRDVTALNQAVRQARAARGELGADVVFEAARGERQFAPGDRLVFLENDRKLGVKNGTLGTVLAGRDGQLTVALDGQQGWAVTFAAQRYANVDHGYAVTLHKAQGVTVDRAYVLATPGMDRHLAYVGMTRHREAAKLYYGRDDFEQKDNLSQTLSRKRQETTTLDFAERRGIETRRGWIEAGRDALTNLGRRLENAIELVRTRGRANWIADASLQTKADERQPDKPAGRPFEDLLTRQRERENAGRRAQHSLGPQPRGSLAERVAAKQREKAEVRQQSEKVDSRSFTAKVETRQQTNQAEGGRFETRAAQVDDRSLSEKVEARQRERHEPPQIGATADRRYLAVPFSEKEQAKELGARWDNEAGAWWIGAKDNAGPFNKWLDPKQAEQARDPKARLEIAQAQVKAADAQLAHFDKRNGPVLSEYQRTFKGYSDRKVQQAARIEAKASKKIDERRNRHVASAVAGEPKKPNGLAAMMPGAMARYETAMAERMREKQTYEARTKTLLARMNFGKELQYKLTQDASYDRVKALAMVERKVARNNPMLAKQAKALQGERQKLVTTKKDAERGLNRARERVQGKQRQRDKSRGMEMD